MSASEKLKALEADIIGGSSLGEDHLVFALPQIVAVVKAAEQVAATTRTEYGQDAPTWAMRFGSVEAALNALDEALT